MTYVVARRPETGEILLGGLGALGVGEMWFDEEPGHKGYPGYGDAPVVGHEPEADRMEPTGTQRVVDGETWTLARYDFAMWVRTDDVETAQKAVADAMDKAFNTRANVEPGSDEFYAASKEAAERKRRDEGSG